MVLKNHICIGLALKFGYQEKLYPQIVYFDHVQPMSCKKCFFLFIITLVYSLYHIYSAPEVNVFPYLLCSLSLILLLVECFPCYNFQLRFINVWLVLKRHQSIYLLSIFLNTHYTLEDTRSIMPLPLSCVYDYPIGNCTLLMQIMPLYLYHVLIVFSTTIDPLIGP